MTKRVKVTSSLNGIGAEPCKFVWGCQDQFVTTDKLRRAQNLQVDEDVAKVREYTVTTIESLTSSHDEHSALSSTNFTPSCTIWTFRLSARRRAIETKK